MSILDPVQKKRKRLDQLQIQLDKLSEQVQKEKKDLQEKEEAQEQPAVVDVAQPNNEPNVIGNADADKPLPEEVKKNIVVKGK